MKRFINFGSIKKFRNIVKDVQHATQYVGLNEVNEPIYDLTKELPVVTARASEKIHGTSAAVCYSVPDGFWVQSKNEIITKEKDNAACAFHAERNQDVWIAIMKSLAFHHGIDLSKNIISVYYEWAGEGIRGKRSALYGLSKRALIFQYFKTSPIEPSPDCASTCHETKCMLVNGTEWIGSGSHDIFNVMNFNPWIFEIDFKDPLTAHLDMLTVVERWIEPDSPVGKTMGVKGNIGEGLVVTFEYLNQIYMFKVKGQEHEGTRGEKIKTPIDHEKEILKITFANHVCTGGRLEQAWQSVFGIGNEKQIPDVKFTGHFLRAVILDALGEESDILEGLGLEPKDVNKYISKIARKWFMDKLDKEVI